MRLVVSLAALVLTVSCVATTYELPDRNAQVTAAEAELAQVVGASFDGADCKVRLLGKSGGASFVWAECSGPLGGVSAPMRVDGIDVAVPEDGSGYDDDVRRMFPENVADAILTDRERMRP